MSSDAIKLVNKYQRDLLREMLSECTIPQQEMFARMYVSVDHIALAKIPRAFEQIEATLKENKIRFTT